MGRTKTNKKTKKSPRKSSTCVFCGKKLANVFCLETHIISHIGERPFSCSYCEATFPFKASEIAHVNNIHLGIKYKCTGCNKVFNCQSNLCNHIKKERCQGARCKRVSKQSKRKNKGGARVVNGPSPKRKQRRSTTTETVVKRRKRKEATQVKPVPVDAGDEEKEERELLIVTKEEGESELSKQEADEITENNNNAHYCKQQTNPFVKPSNQDYSTFLEISMLLDLTKKKQAEAQRRWDPDFFLHLGRYRPEDSSAKITVNVTSAVKVKMESEETTLMSESTQSDVNDNDRVDIHKCEQCNKLYSTKWNLLKHSKIHTGKMEYQCHFCQKLFFEKCNVVRHIISMHQNPERDPTVATIKNKPRCGFCGERFSGGAFPLSRHILTEHNEMLLVSSTLEKTE